MSFLISHCYSSKRRNFIITFPLPIVDVQKGYQFIDKTSVTPTLRIFSEDLPRLPKISEDFRERPEDVSITHNRI